LGLTIGEANKRYHEKLFIVDGELPTATAITGGVNLGNNYFRVDTENAEEMWRDRDVLIRGDVVQDMVRAFELTYQEFFTKRSSGLFGDTSNYWNWANLLLGKKGRIPMDDMRPEIVQRLQSLATASFQPVFIPADFRFLQSRPRFEEDLIMPAFIDMITRSQSEILINNSYFLPDEEFKGALQAAIKRGVKVKIVTNHVENTDFSQLHLLARTEYKDFLKFNAFGNGEELVEIYEWAGDPVLGNGEGLNHSKYAVFDGRAVMVGSFNIDPRSRDLNSEAVVFMENPEVAKIFQSEFSQETQPKFAEKVSFFQSQSFEDPDGLREKFELKISEILRPLL
jgi:putative cardiolipin synthase